VAAAIAAKATNKDVRCLRMWISPGCFVSNHSRANRVRTESASRPARRGTPPTPS
jgi:hypothetical protein